MTVLTYLCIASLAHNINPLHGLIKDRQLQAPFPLLICLRACSHSCRQSDDKPSHRAVARPSLWYRVLLHFSSLAITLVLVDCPPPPQVQSLQVWDPPVFLTPTSSLAPTFAPDSYHAFSVFWDRSFSPSRALVVSFGIMAILFTPFHRTHR
jgi:hypothetical protein